VLLLHGIALPYFEMYHGQTSVLVGNRTCPFLPHRSDPMGTRLACGPIPPLEQSRSMVHDMTVPAELVDMSSQGRIGCFKCAVTYSPELQAHATLSLTHRLGVEGDVVTVAGVGEWPLLQESYGHHEQLTATIGGHDALPRFPASDAIFRPSTEHPWLIGLALPPLTAGQYDLRLSIDRLWHDDGEVCLSACLSLCACASVFESNTSLHILAGARHNRSGRWG
jgi:hypothetical protein